MGVEDKKTGESGGRRIRATDLRLLISRLLPVRAEGGKEKKGKLKALGRRRGASTAHSLIFEPLCVRALRQLDCNCSSTPDTVHRGQVTCDEGDPISCAPIAPNKPDTVPGLRTPSGGPIKIIIITRLLSVNRGSEW